jgi:hypothetical protein
MILSFRFDTLQTSNPMFISSLKNFNYEKRINFIAKFALKISLRKAFQSNGERST